MTTRNILFVGDGGVGKSAFIHSIRTGEFEKIYTPTQDVDTTELSLPDGKFRCIEFPGQEKLAEQKFTQVCRNIDAVIGMFDLTSRISYRNLSVWIRKIRNINPNIPIIVCGNKVDCKEHKVKFYQSDFPGMRYFEVSAKNGHNGGIFNTYV